MSQIYDLDLFLDETYEIKLHDLVFTLPKQPLTGLQKKVTAIQYKISQLVNENKRNADPVKLSELMQESVILILKQDKEMEKKVTSKFIDENFTDNQIQKIVKIFFNELKDVEAKN